MLKALSSLIIIAGTFSMSVFAKGWTTDGSDWFYYDSNEILVTSAIKPSGNEKYYLDENGFMVRDYLLEDYNEAVYYFDEDGKMVTNTWVAVDTTQVRNGMDNPPSVYLYYFGTNGKAYTGTSDRPAKKTIDGKKYLFNENGQMLSGWIDEAGVKYDIFNTEEDPFVGYCYYAGDETDGVLREGWSSYEDGSVDDKYYKKETLWFYFKPGSCKKICSSSSDEYKKYTINGKQYGFDENGVMIQGWETDMIPGIRETKNYFSESALEDERGRLYKKEWIFAVPSSIMSETPSTDEQGLDRPDANDHDEEIQRWFYALGSGDIAKNVMRKINGNYFVFNKAGVMRHGLCVIEKGTNKFVDCIDLEKTDGKDFIMSRMYVSLDSYSAAVPYKLFDDTKHKLFYFETDEQASDFGLRKIGDHTVSFMDDDYTFSSTNQGENEGLKKKKKYYQAGILLKAEASLGLGLIFEGHASTSDALKVDFKPGYGYNGAPASNRSHQDKNHKIDGLYEVYTDYIVDDSVSFCTSTYAYPVYKVVDAKGSIIKKSNNYVKDKAGHYWLLGAGGALVKIFDIPIKYNKSEDIWYFKSEKEDTSTHKISTTWIPFYDSPGLLKALATDSDMVISSYATDMYGKSCYLKRDMPADKNKTYETYIDDSYATNFRFYDGN